MKNKSFLYLPILFLVPLHSAKVYLDATKYGVLQRNFLTTYEYKITKEEIEKLGVESILELLKIYNVDVYTRSDVQQDFSLNGGTFEQVKILVDGIPFNDPQTGHHNCNLPLNLDDIEYIQIIKSGNFSFYGNNAFCGVINIVTKKRTNNSLSLSYGSFDTYKINTTANFDFGYISADISGSSGYRDNTDYETYNIFAKYNFKNTNFNFGFLSKDFGAQDFYAVNRKEYEETKTFFASANRSFVLKENINFNFGIYLRKGFDYYTTQRYKQEVYYNRHFSSVYGSKGIFNIKVLNNLSLIPIFEITFKQLDSRGSSTVLPDWQGMGKFSDEEYALGVGLSWRIKKFLFESTFKENYFSRYSFLPQYTAQLAFIPNLNNKIFVSTSKVFRTPSYTELFYWDPNHQTTEDLKIEKTDSYQFGIENKIKNFSLQTLYYYMTPVNAIDWMRTKNSNESWKITNISKVELYGYDLSVSWKFPDFETKILYSSNYKNFDIPEDKELKYIENYPKNSLSLILFLPKIFGIESSVTNTYKVYTKTQPKEFLLTNVSLSKTINNIKFSFSIENLFNVKYEEIPGIQQPPFGMFLQITYR
jgi:iron complex outermembrane receptor protein